MFTFSKSNMGCVIAYFRGYRVVNGELYNPKGIKINIYLSGHCIYSTFNIRIGGPHIHIPVHRLVAYQKYKEKIFQPGIEVRHLDGNPLNNNEDNISIGNHTENMHDIPNFKDFQNKILYKANRVPHKGKTGRKYTNKEVEDIRNYHKEVKSYKKTMLYFNIDNKSTLRYILRANYVMPHEKDYKI